jgi:hypothetical protein
MHKLSQNSSADFSFDIPFPKPVIEGSRLADIQGLRCTDRNQRAVVMFWISRMEPHSTREISITHNIDSPAVIDSNVMYFATKPQPRRGDLAQATGTFNFDEPLTCNGDILFQLASPISELIHDPSPPQRPPSEAHPDLSLRFVIKKNLSLTIVNGNTSRATNPRYSVQMTNIDNPQNAALRVHENGTIISLPNATEMLNDYVPGKTALGPYSLGNRWEERGLLKPGDRMFGMASIGCPDCTRIHYYYVYAVHGQDGWYCESETPLSLLAVVNIVIETERGKDDPSNYCPAGKRVAIEDMTGNLDKR